jgi:periplasmic divalent cation tolerance protein
VATAPGCCQITTTLPDRAAAEQLAATVVGERWAACAQVAGPIASTFRWHDAVERAEEWYCHCKTTEAAAAGLRARIRELHPYEVPEIIVVPVVDGDPAYLRWIEASVRTDAHSAGTSLPRAPLPPGG